MRHRSLRSLAAAAALALGITSIGPSAHAQFTASIGNPDTGPQISYQNFDAPSPLPNIGDPGYPATLAPSSGSQAGGTMTVSFIPDGTSATGFQDSVFAAPYVVAGSGAPFGNFTGQDTSSTDPVSPGPQPAPAQYLSAGTGAAILSFQKDQNYLGLLWGSIDTYNHLSFYENGTLVGKIDGTDSLFTGVAFGDHGAAGSAYVNITGIIFNSVVATSDSKAFEFDNVAYRAVPEPASMAMCATALVGLTGVAVRRKKARAAKA